MATNKTIPSLDGSEQIPVYEAKPAGAPKAAIIVIQEIFGINRGIRAKTDQWAEQGYLAYAPELFWRFAPGVELDADQPEQFSQALGLMGQLDELKAMQDVEAVIRHARAALGDGGKVGLVGFCLGGRIAYLAATRTDIDASVGYYGVGIDQAIGESHAIARPLMLHIPTADAHVGPAAQAAIHDGLGDNRHVTLHDYEGSDHGFASEFGNRREPEPAAQADERTKAFFAEHLA